MFFTKKSERLQAISALVALGLLAVACGSEKKKDENPQAVQVQAEGPNVRSTPEPTPSPQTPPAPAATPVPVPEPVPVPASPTPAVTPEPKPSLPPARALTEAETLQYLTNTDSFIRTDDTSDPRGTGFDTARNSFVAECMQHDPNLLLLTRDARPAQEYQILPLTSARQLKEALGYQGASLYMSRRFDISRADQIGIVAIAKKIRKVEVENSMILRSRFSNVDDETFADRCGQVYKKGDVSGHVTYAVLWLELDAENTKEGLLSRLIDSKTLGSYQDLETFSAQLQSLKRQLSHTDTLTMKGLEAGSNFTGGMPPSFSFDFSPTLKAWSDASDKVELAEVPEIGSIFSSYPDRSTPSALTGGRSR
jgi:hypothetical protein